MTQKFTTPGTLPTPRQQEILTILAEEGTEVIEIMADMAKTICAMQKRGSKAKRFGLDEVQPGQPHDNATRLGLEIGDLLEMIDMAIAEGILTPEAIEKGRENKRRQIAKFMQTEPGA